MNKHKKASLIQKIFFCPQEKIVHCPCSLTSYAFNYKKYFSIDLNKENNSVLLSKKILEKEISYGNEKCSFCFKDNLKSESFLIDFSEILIVILKGYHYEKFSISNNLKLCNDKVHFYNLLCFVELYTNIVYFKDDNNNWLKFLGNNIKEKVEDIETIKPKILFYKNIKNRNNNNESNNINNLNNFSSNNVNKNNIININQNKAINNSNNNINNNLNNMSNKNINNNNNMNFMNINNMMMMKNFNNGNNNYKIKEKQF